MSKMTLETVTPAVARESIIAFPVKEANWPTETQSKLYRALFCDIAQHFPNFVFDDFRYLIKRLLAEPGFEYQILPLLGKAFEISIISLETFKVPNGWKLQKNTRLPKFMYELFSQLFHDDGQPRFTISNQGSYTEKAFHACRYIRQVCLMFSKVVPASTQEDGTIGLSDVAGDYRQKTSDALNAFADRVSRKVIIENNDPYNKSFLSEARRLLRCVLSEHSMEHGELMDFAKNPWGRHGPGAVADREVGCEKWVFASWPGLPTNLFSWGPGKDCEYAGRKPKSIQPDARVCAVPKDFRGPRIICIEPKENQFAQQGLMDILYRLTMHHYLTRNSISFIDTEESRWLCYNNSFATIDLKDASDNLSLTLGKLLLPRWFFSLVTRYRSRHVIVRNPRDGDMRVKTTCLATMGNATCFPLQTLVFWAIALGTMISIRDAFHKTQRDKLNLTLRVFGDDIIVPLWAADGVCYALETCGLKVNHAKTCTFSPVRESCGEWVFMNKPVQIYRFRTTSVTDHSSYLHWRDHIRDLTQVDFPALRVAALEIVDAFFTPTLKRWNKKLQRLEVLAPMFVQHGPRAELPGYTGLYAWHVSGDRTPFLRGIRKRVKMRWQDAAVVRQL